MTYDEVLAGLIRRAVSNCGIRSHDRVVLTRYSPHQARRIVERLITDGDQATVEFYRDNGDVFSSQLPAVRVSSGTASIEVLPYVVTADRASSDPIWYGSQAFAGKLRSCFTHGASEGVTRILLLFDEHPVETEHSTALEPLADAMESLKSLNAWIASDEWAGALPAELRKAITVIISSWEKARDQAQYSWRRSHIEELESLATFADQCRAAITIGDIGGTLSKLGLLFDDPDLDAEPERKWEKRIAENFAIAHQLEEIRTQRVFDALTDAERIVSLGSPGEPFYDSMSAALAAPNLPVTHATVTYSDIAARRRSGEQTLAWLDVAGLRVTELNDAGEPTGGELQWTLLREPALPPDGGDPAEVVLATTAKRIRVHLPVNGTIPSELYVDGNHYPLTEFPNAKLTPKTEIAVDVDVPLEMGIRSFAVRAKRPGRGRLARPYQEVYVAIVPGTVAPIPEGARLDVKDDAYLVDNTAHEIPVRVGAQTIMISGESLPPDDGSPGVFTIENVNVRWKGEDRGSSNDPMARSKSVRLRELLGARQTGTPSATQAYFTESNDLGVVCQTAATVDVSADELAAEAALINDPSRFAGTPEMSATASAELMRATPEYFARWLAARRLFFTAICAESERLLPGVGRDRPSMYLVDLRDPEFARLAEDYVDSYCDLLKEVSRLASGSANAAVIEPVLLCDRAFVSEDAVSIAPTHPLAVALLATIQRAFFTREWHNASDREGLESLFAQSLLAGVLPWLPWRGAVLTASRCTPLLWRRYGTDGGTVDTSDDLGPIITDKVRQHLDLAPHLKQSNQRVYLNVEIGAGTGDYVSRAMRELINDDKIKCAFDIGIVRSVSGAEPSLLAAFSGGSRTVRGGDTDQFRRAVRVAEIDTVASREAHLVFRMEAAHAEKNAFTTLTNKLPLVRSTSFAAGLAEEPARFATLRESEVIYTRYVHSAREWFEPAPAPNAEELWDGPWRRRFMRVIDTSRTAVIGLRNAISADTIACQTLRQNADTATAIDYDKSFVTVHCDPTQGPEFFVGSRATKSKVFLVECSDRGSPQLPGRDIVTVTSRIGPFRAALAAAVRRLPEPLRKIVDDEVAKGLLRDINLLRGTEVFSFLRESARESSHIHILDGLDNILALRLLLNNQLAVAGHFPIVVSMRDLANRSAFFKQLRTGLQCDDVLVIYIPLPSEGDAQLRYRLTEVKFGQRRELKRKAIDQLAETARKLANIVPPGIWRDEPSVVPLMMEKDLAWMLHESLERYRSFGLIPADESFEEKWRIGELFHKMHAGRFSLLPLQPEGSGLVNGTALLFDPEIPGDALQYDYEATTEIITVPVEAIKFLLTHDAQASATGVTAARVNEISAEAEIKGADQLQGSNHSRSGVSERLVPEQQSTRTDRDAMKNAIATESTAVAINSQSSDTGCSEDNVVGDQTTRAELNKDLTARMSQVDDLFLGFIGNAGPVSKLKRSLAIALFEGRRTVEPIALFGPKSTGKTELARRVARVLAVPRIELSETTFRSADDLANKIIETSASIGDRMPNVRLAGGAVVRRAPAMIVFIDEVHQLKSRATDCLLTATEPDDRKLLSTQGTIDTRDITFIIATTDPGELSDPLKSRVYRLELREYEIEELVEIMRAHHEQNDDFPQGAQLFDDECLRVIARAGRLIPRQALRLFREAARDANVGFLEPTAESLQQHYLVQDGIDSEGLTNRDRAYLRVLFPDHVLGVEALCAHLGERLTTVTQDVEPYLLRLKLIERARTGRKLTARGRIFAASHAGR